MFNIRGRKIDVHEEHMTIGHSRAALVLGFNYPFYKRESRKKIQWRLAKIGFSINKIFFTEYLPRDFSPVIREEKRKMVYTLEVMLLFWKVNIDIFEKELKWKN